MKTLLVIMFLWGTLQVNAQEFVYEQREGQGYVLVKTEKYDSLRHSFTKTKMPAYCNFKDLELAKKEGQEFREEGRNEHIFDILKKNKGYFSLTCIYDKEGNLVDAYFSVNLNLIDKFTKEDFQYMYGKAKRQKLNMENVRKQEGREHYLFIVPFSYKDDERYK